MRLGLLAKKIGMSRFYDSLGINHPVTILKVDEANIVDIKTNEKNGYSAIRLSLGKSKRKNNKSVKGFLKKKNIPAFLFSKEFRVSETANYKIGDDIEDIKQKSASLSQVMMKLGEAAYKDLPDDNNQETTEDSPKKDDADVVDADFEEVDNEKKDK
jgi:ribosomal protein L3